MYSYSWKWFTLRILFCFIFRILYIVFRRYFAIIYNSVMNETAQFFFQSYNSFHESILRSLLSGTIDKYILFCGVFLFFRFLHFLSHFKSILQVLLSSLFPHRHDLFTSTTQRDCICSSTSSTISTRPWPLFLK